MKRPSKFHSEVRILDLLCLMDPSLVTRIFPAVKKAARMVATGDFLFWGECAMKYLGAGFVLTRSMNEPQTASRLLGSLWGYHYRCLSVVLSCHAFFSHRARSSSKLTKLLWFAFCFRSGVVFASVLQFFVNHGQHVLQQHVESKRKAQEFLGPVGSCR